MGVTGAGAFLVDVSGATSLESAAQALIADPRVQGASPDYVVQAAET